MPNTKSAKKRLKQNLARRDRNRAVKSALKTQIKKARTAGGGQGTAEFQAAQKALDQAAARGAIHKNKAARLKSRLVARVKAAKTA